MAYALDQNLGNNSGADGITTLTLTTAQTVAAGGWIFVGVGWWRSTTTVSSVSGGGLTWVLNGTQGNGASNRSALAYAYAASGLAASTVLTVTWNAPADDSGVGAVSFTGGDSSSVAENTATTSAATAAHSVSVTSSTSGDLILSVGKCDTQTANTPDGNSTELIDVAIGGNAARFLMQYRVASAAGSYAVGGTWGAADWSEVGVAFSPASGGGAGSATVKQLAALGVG